MKIIIIGAVAAGTSAGAKARRNDETAQITIYDKDNFISYSGCGLPYYIGESDMDINELTPRDPAFFKSKYNIDVFTNHEVIDIDTTNKKVTVRNNITNETIIDTYDKLVFATGASARIPDIKGTTLPHVFPLRNVTNAKNIKSYIEAKKPKNAVILGSGFVGFEMLENLLENNIEATIIESKSHITSTLDEDVSKYFESELKKQNIKIIKNTTISEIYDDKIVLDDNTELSCNLVIISIGVSPNTDLAKKININLGKSGAIVVDNTMKTNIEDIYACGDCIETFNLITKENVYRPLGSTANKTGRICGDVITGGSLTYRGNLGSSIFKTLNITVANTGLTEKEAKEKGYEVTICHNIKPDKATYFDGQEMLIKAIADSKTQKLLGVQIVGGVEGVDKRIDVFATLITYGAEVSELFHLDLAYAPPFSTTKDPVHYTGMILDNDLNNNRKIITTENLKNLVEKEDVQLIDCRATEQYEKSKVLSAQNIPQSKLRVEQAKLDKNKITVTYCNKGVTGNACQNMLINLGFKKVYNLSGGHTFHKKSK